MALDIAVDLYDINGIDNNAEYIEHLFSRFNLLSHARHLVIRHSSWLDRFMTDRHWERLETINTLEISIDYLDFDSEVSVDRIRRVLSLPGVSVKLDTYMDLTPLMLDLMDTIPRLTSVYLGLRNLGMASANPLFTRLFDILLSHRQTLESIIITGYDQTFLPRWLQALDSFPRASRNLLTAAFPDDFQPLLYDKMTTAGMASQLHHNISTITAAQWLTKYLEREHYTGQPRTITVIIPSDGQIHLVGTLLKCRHLDDVTISFGGQTPFHIPERLSIRALSMRAMSYQLFECVDMSKLVAPNLIRLSLSPVRYDSDVQLAQITSMISTCLPNLLQFDINLVVGNPAGTFSNDSVQRFYLALGRHPVLQSLGVRHFNHTISPLRNTDIIIMGIRQSATIQKVKLSNVSLELFQSSAIGHNLFEKIEVYQSRGMIGYRLLPSHVLLPSQ
eukprot:gene17020-20268_t